MTRIGPSISIQGDITSAEDLQIDGRVQGYVLVRDAALTIGREGRIDADVRGAHVTVHGALRGSITASERIELTAGAHVEGSLSANFVVLVDGARFNGRIDMGQRTIASRVAHYKEQQTASGL